MGNMDKYKGGESAHEQKSWDHSKDEKEKKPEPKKDDEKKDKK